MKRHKNIKKAVREFKQKNKIKQVDLDSIQQAAENQGYTIIEYNQVNNSEDVSVLIEELNLHNQVLTCNCFAYQDERCRLLFVNEELNAEERLIVLCHEVGHIWLNHMKQGMLVGTDVIEEYEANEFAHYLIADYAGSGGRRAIITAMLVSVALIIFGGGLKYYHDLRVYQDDWYITETGHKYHTKNCVYIRNRKDIKKMTKEEYESGDYDACSVCILLEE